MAALKKIPLIAWVFALTHAALVLWLLARTPVCQDDCRQSGTRLVAERKIQLIGEPPPFNYLITFDMPALILSTAVLYPVVRYSSVATYLDALFWIGPTSVMWGLLGWGMQYMIGQILDLRHG